MGSGLLAAPTQVSDDSTDHHPSSSNWAVSAVLRPFALPGFRPASTLLWPLLTPPGALAPEVSPSKNTHFRSHSAGLYLMRFSVTVGFRVYTHAHRPHPASLPVRVPAAVPLLPAAFSVGLTAAAWRFTTLAVTASGHHVSDNELVFMSGTRVAGCPRCGGCAGDAFGLRPRRIPPP